MAILLLISMNSFGQTWYGQNLCKQADYHCIKAKRGDSWGTLFPNTEKRDLIRRINRMNIFLQPGMVIAVPNNLNNLTIYDVSPFPRYIESDGEKSIYVDLHKLAWAAYDVDGKLLWWGPISPGAGQISKYPNAPTTPTGTFHIFRKQGADCISNSFPQRIDGDNGGAKMPFCMHFYRGYALHGSVELPGYAASEGCLRLFIEDAQWLNERFVDLPSANKKGTRVVVYAQGNPFGIKMPTQ
ncbi:L,D-transpeptidase [Legionella nagasakiensis]|uniref:L,D-transpeptidase n=1 Tax=Legionella nagasakiensis TaxID=535290 RepID=UPI001F5F4D6F|nr:L,D-transpeptidase [Legionella nagasakiensis]